MDEITTALGKAFRDFQSDICSFYNTRELPREAAARQRRQQRQTQNVNPTVSVPSSESQPRKKEFNLKTYKHHALGDYVATIRLFGTTDSYSTQVVCVLLVIYISVDLQRLAGRT